MFARICQLVFLTMAMMGCGPDYSIVGEIGKEYIFIEVPDPSHNEEIWVDSFVQPSSVQGVDILWVIDTSGSMNDEEPELLLGIETMMNSLPPSGWRLNMISNSAPNVRTDAQFPLVPGDTPEDAKAMFYSMTGGVYEQGFDAVETYMLHNPYATQWMRHDAALLVVFVSDEEDQSNQSVDEFIHWYTALRSNVYLASIVHLDPADSLCNYSTYNAGYNSIEATNRLNGVVVDICSEDWAPGVTDASTQVEPYESYKLTHRPSDINSIRVFVNGSPDNAWYYEPSDNTIYFTTTPAAEDLVEMAYLYLPRVVENAPELPSE